MRFAHYCTCGTKWAGTITPDTDYEKLKAALWEPYHSGLGHEPTNAATAGRVRRKADADERAENVTYLQD